MKTTLVKKIELFTNIAIILVALILGAVLVKKFLLTDTTASQPKKDIAVGEKVNFEQINWASNKNTLVLVLSKDCHYCTESLPFYQKINQEIAKNPSVKIAAVFPQDVQTAQEYLKANNLDINQVYKGNPSAVGAGGTPTLILVDENGKVVETWFGKLMSSDEEQKVLDRLRSVSANG